MNELDESENGLFTIISRHEINPTIKVALNIVIVIYVQR
jgi:hypothetical protein